MHLQTQALRLLCTTLAIFAIASSALEVPALHPRRAPFPAGALLKPLARREESATFSAPRPAEESTNGGGTRTIITGTGHSDTADTSFTIPTGSAHTGGVGGATASTTAAATSGASVTMLTGTGASPTATQTGAAQSQSQSAVAAAAADDAKVRGAAGVLGAVGVVLGLFL